MSSCALQYLQCLTPETVRGRCTPSKEHARFERGTILGCIAQFKLEPGVISIVTVDGVGR